MGWKRNLMEAAVWAANLAAKNSSRVPLAPGSIFVLRNNDIGDLIVVTPLFAALKKQFPGAKIIAGIGDWNRPVLENNPHVAEILPLNAPWHNKFIPGQSLGKSLRYIYASGESRALRERRFDVGIDVLGSPFGSLLLMRAGIPFRLGVRGYAGGHTGAQRAVEFNGQEHVGRSALRFAELLGATDLPPNRPQIFLTAAESRAAGETWNALASTARGRRIVVSPGGGFREKCWPADHFETLVKALAGHNEHRMIVVGGAADRAPGERLAAAGPGVKNLAGQNDLRATFALVAGADLVICNSSMLMHVAAAFEKPAVVVLGEWFDSASQQMAQWGYPGLTHFLGKQNGRVAAPAEAIALVQQFTGT